MVMLALIITFSKPVDFVFSNTLSFIRNHFIRNLVLGPKKIKFLEEQKSLLFTDKKLLSI